MLLDAPLLLFFFFNDTATTEIYTLSLHDALPIYALGRGAAGARLLAAEALHPVAGDDAGVQRVDVHVVGTDLERHGAGEAAERDRKSTRLNSSHLVISYAVFCLKKKKITHDALPH